MTVKCSRTDTRRTYVLYPYEMVTDHMTGLEYGNPHEILDGNIDELLLTRIRRRAEEDPDRALWGNDEMGPCSYCGQMYKQSSSRVHFIPCCYCNDLEHPGCKH